MICFGRHLPPIAWRLARATVSLLAVAAFVLVAPAELRHLSEHGACETSDEPRTPCQPCAVFQQLLQVEPAPPVVPPADNTAVMVGPPQFADTAVPDRISLASRSPPLS